MAHTLSSQQYSSTSYQQCSPSTSSHAYSSSSSGNSNYHRSMHAASGVGGYQQAGSKLKLSDFRGKSWSSFGDALANESSDDDTDTEAGEDPLAIPSTTATRTNRGSVVRLKRRDFALYGFRPETDPFTIVTCRHCRKVLKASALRRHIDMRHEPVVKLDRIDEISGAVEKISVESSSGSGRSEKRHRHASRKPEEVTMVEATAPAVVATPPLPPPAAPLPVPPLVATTVSMPSQQPSESSSASNSPQPRRKKRKQDLQSLPLQQQQQQSVPTQVTTTETFHASTAAAAAAPQLIATQQATAAPCRIIMSSSPPPLAPITNEAPPASVWIVTPSPAVIIDGSFVMKPLEAAELDTEIDLKDLKVLKPAIKEPQAETATSLTPSNWYTAQPRPLALNTFNMRKISAQRYVMATQRKLIELGRTLRQDDKITSAVVKPQPKTWSFIERSQVFIPFRVTH